VVGVGAGWDSCSGCCLAAGEDSVAVGDTVEAGLVALAVGVGAVDLAGLAVGVRVVVGRVAVGSGVPGILARPRPTLTGERSVAPSAGE